MRLLTTCFVALVCAVGLGCGERVENEGVQGPSPVPEGPSPTSEILDRPFTAAQIRDEWIVGFEVRTRHWSSDAEVFERWKVVQADGEGLDIAAVAVDRAGVAVGEEQVRHSTWEELRDHASFPSRLASREKTVLETPLGEHEGWLYTMTNPDSSTVSEFFFAEALPGAPVIYRNLVDGEVIELFEQVHRFRPDAPEGRSESERPH